MNCPRCATPIAPGSFFCPRCGFQFAQQVLQKKSSLSTPVILLLVCLGSCGLCGLVGAVVSTFSPKRDVASNKTANASNVNTASSPAPAPVPMTFAELKAEANRLLALGQESYQSVELSEFDKIMKPLKDIPQSSKDYKAAQALHKKLIDKVAVIGTEQILLGPKPLQSGWDGDVLPVKQYLRQVLNDYDSSEFVEWSPVGKTYIGKEPYWSVRLRLRAKNAFGAYITRDTYYYIRNNQVVLAKGLGVD